MNDTTQARRKFFTQAEVKAIREGRKTQFRELVKDCGGTGLYTAYSSFGGAMPDTDCRHCDTGAKMFANHWESKHGPGSFNDDWVFAFTFERVDSCAT